MPFKVTADYAAAVTLKVFLSVLTFALALTGYCCGADFGSRTTPVSPSSLTVAPSPTVSGTPLPSFPPIPPERLMNFPPLVGPSRTFIFEGELSYRVSDYTWQSRVVLYDNGACLLQYPPSVGGIYGEGRLPGATVKKTGSSCSCSSHLPAGASTSHGVMRPVPQRRCARGPAQRDSAAFGFRERCLQTLSVTIRNSAQGES